MFNPLRYKVKIFAISDLHLDYESNRNWFFSLDQTKYRYDILILAGDISDDLTIISDCFKYLSGCFRFVVFVPGNHDLWVLRCKHKNSLKKFYEVMELADRNGIITKCLELKELCIIPLISWYDFSFGNPNFELKENWMDFQACRWPEGYDNKDINQYFLAKNQLNSNSRDRKCTITVSHFLPTLDILPKYIPERFNYLWPVLGSRELGEQVSAIEPNIHIYGHSHVNQDIVLDGIRYVNSAFGYPNETYISKKKVKYITTVMD